MRISDLQEYLIIPNVFIQVNATRITSGAIHTTCVMTETNKKGQHRAHEASKALTYTCSRTVVRFGRSSQQGSEENILCNRLER